jgi:hypothetical protein
MKPFIASIVRNLLQVVAGALVAYGVTNQDASAWVTASEPVITGLILYIVAQAWSFINLKSLQKLGERFKL